MLFIELTYTVVDDGDEFLAAYAFLLVTRMLLLRHLLSNDTCSPATLAPRIVEGVGASVGKDEGEAEVGDEFWF